MVGIGGVGGGGGGVGGGGGGVAGSPTGVAVEGLELLMRFPKVVKTVDISSNYGDLKYDAEANVSTLVPSFGFVAGVTILLLFPRAAIRLFPPLRPCGGNLAACQRIRLLHSRAV